VIDNPATQRTFPATRVSVIEALKSSDTGTRRAAEELMARAYWGPVVTMLGWRWKLEPADAEDLAQEFFSEALPKQWLQKFDAGKGRFRTFLRVCVDRFAANALQSATRMKRGGGAALLPLDDATAVAASGNDDPETRFRQEWVRSVFALALDALREDGRTLGKRDQVAIFEAYDVQDLPDDKRPSYRDLATAFNLPETTVTNHLAWARRAFRGHVLDVLRSLAGSDAEYRADAQELLGVRVS
jgi:DNA-directed RNA polymerase specialized sigma24 family protein